MPFLDRVLPRLDRVDRERVEGILKALAQERDFLDKVLNLLYEGIVVVDRDGRICFTNRAAESILAQARTNLIGNELRETVRDSRLRGLIEEAVHNRAGILGKEITLEPPAQDRLTVSMVPLEDGTGEFTGAVFTFRNTTAEMLRQLRYAQMKQIQTFSVMAAGIAHEVGNPLNSLDIHLQLIERHVKRMKRGKKRNERGLLDLLAVAQEEIKRLEHIVGQFLKATRPDTPALEEGEIIPMLDKTLAFMGPEIRRHGIEVEKQYADFVPPVMLNADQMRQVFINLIQNAIQAMPSGGLIRVTVECGRGHVTVSVSDSGKGITDEHRERIFEPYFTTREGGAGLGLMIVQRIVGEHGGEVLVSSGRGSGTTMTVKLPVPSKYGKLLPGRKQAKN